MNIAYDKTTNKTEAIIFNGMHFGQMLNYGGFGVALDIEPYRWAVYAREGGIYYSTKETSSLSDLQPLSMIEWGLSTNYGIYIYKSDSVKAPDGMTYVGEAHIASTGGVGGPKAIAYDHVTKKSYNMVYNSMWPYSSQKLTDFTFSLTTSNSWQISTTKNNIYYSTKETDNAAELTKLSSVNFGFGNTTKYYIYRK